MTAKRLICILLVLVLTLTFAAPVWAAESRAVDADGYRFEKVSNPSSGPGEADGLNTKDETGFAANRLNSYAWAVASRGDYIYIGTNRTLLGSGLNTISEAFAAFSDLTPEAIADAVSVLSSGQIPVNLKPEEYVPQIIRFDVKNGSTKVIYQPATAAGADGVLYYTGRDGSIVEDAKVVSETCSFRSVVEFGGCLYFGSLGANMVQLVRIDENDNASIVFQTTASLSSLRACAIHDGGDGETVYFGGQDTTYAPWRAYRQNNPDDPVLPIVIRCLDPATAGSDAENWDNYVADFRDFGEYARASVYVMGGGNVWDLCSYNGYLYLILAYDGGWAMFRGEQGGAHPNSYGWTWTEIVGNNGRYPLAMNGDIAALNREYAAKYGCSAYNKSLTGTGLLESTATPYVYNGKMYIGSFDNATCVLSQTVVKALIKLVFFNDPQLPGNGPTLAQIFAPVYQVLSHPQHIWVMDQDENILPVDSANGLLADSTAEYVWRFMEHDGRLYAGTFDSATAYSHFVNISMKTLLSSMGITEDDISRQFDLIIGDVSELDRSMVENSDAYHTIAAFFKDEATVEQLYESIRNLEGERTRLVGKQYEDVNAVIDRVLELFDPEGLEYWVKAREIVNNADQGADILVSEDGVNWRLIVSDGLHDRYNYGARTFTESGGELYLGTANPYYGGQLWRIAEIIDNPTGFRDVPAGSYFCDAVAWAVQNGITKGVSKSVFAPDLVCTRAQMVSFLYRAAGSPEAGAYDGRFADVQPEDWFADAVAWAVNTGVARGVSADEFRPDETVSRAQAVTFLYRYLQAAPDAEAGFTDVAADAYYYDAVAWAAQTGVTAGTTPTAFSPDSPCTRAQIVTFLYRALAE